MEAQIDIKGLIKSLSILKCYYRINAYGELNSQQNKVNTIKEYLQYSYSKSWQYMIQYSSIIYLQLKFIINMCKELKVS